MFRIKSKVFGIENFTVYASERKPTGPRNVFTLRTIYGTILHEFEVNELLQLEINSSILPIVPRFGLSTERPRGRSSSPGGINNFHFSISSRPALGSIQPPIQWVPGDISPGVKRHEREADHSPPTSAEVKKTWIHYIHSPIRLHSVVFN
jgi:hypothetical protein